MKSIALTLAVLIATSPVYGRVARQADHSRVAMNNRSAPSRSVSRPSGNISPQAHPSMQSHQNMQGSRNISGDRNLSANQNVNRNVNRNMNANVNRNINVDRDIDVDYDHDWGWGSFAAGAAIGATTGAIVGAATSGPSTVVVASPTVGTTVTALPGGCMAVGTGSAVMYNCNNVYYQPYYQGSTLAYQVVANP